MIRELTVEDLPLVEQPARSFFLEGKQPGVFNFPHFCKSWANLINSKMGVIFGAFDKEGRIVGGIGGSVFPCINTGDLLATELYWYILPENRGALGVRLLRQFETWAALKGAKRIWMLNLVALHDDSMEHLYHRMGYRLEEKIYLKEFKP